MTSTKQFLSDFCRDLVAHPGDRPAIIKGYSKLLDSRENAARDDELDIVSKLRPLHQGVCSHIVNRKKVLRNDINTSALR
jgi:hypothetical protein